MKYTIRRLGGDCWLDECEFFRDSQIGSSEASGIVAEMVAKGEVRVAGVAVMCLVQRMGDGRERQIGRDVVVGRDGSVSEIE